MVVPSNNRLVAIFATDFNMGEPLGHNEFLLISALLNKNHLVILHEGAAHLNGFGYIAKLPRSVASHDEGIRVIITFGRCQSSGK